MINLWVRESVNQSIIAPVSSYSICPHSRLRVLVRKPCNPLQPSRRFVASGRGGIRPTNAHKFVASGRGNPAVEFIVTGMFGLIAPMIPSLAFEHGGGGFGFDGVGEFLEWDGHGMMACSSRCKAVWCVCCVAHGCDLGRGKGWFSDLLESFAACCGEFAHAGGQGVEFDLTETRISSLTQRG